MSLAQVIAASLATAVVAGFILASLWTAGGNTLSVCLFFTGVITGFFFFIVGAFVGSMK